MVAASDTWKNAILIANYNRPEDKAGIYAFLRPDHPRLEMKVWEAAAATSATPILFRHFYHGATLKGYVDGVIHSTNPVSTADQERRYLWPDVMHHHPDHLLSIGTGENAATIRNRGR